MARVEFTAPSSPELQRKNELNALQKRPSRSPQENARYIQLLEEEVSRLKTLNS